MENFHTVTMYDFVNKYHILKNLDHHSLMKYIYIYIYIYIYKGKAVPLEAWSGPVGSRKLRFPDFMTMAQDSGKVVSLTHRPPLPPGNTPGTHFS